MAETLTLQDKYFAGLKELMPKIYNLDADTVRDEKGDVRYENLNAPEVQHMTPEGLTHGEWGGDFYADLYNDLAADGGYDKVYRTGEKGYYGRDLGGREDEFGEAFQDKLYYEGLARPKNEETQELTDMGVFARAFQSDVGGVDEDDIWEKARKKVEEYNRQTMVGFKDLATNESEKAAYDAVYGNTYSPFYQHDVAFRHPDRDLDNAANSNFKTSWLIGWGSIKESALEGVSVLGDLLGSEELYEYGEIRSNEIQFKNRLLPKTSMDLLKVENLSDFGDWVASISGVALPYMLGLIGTRLAGSVVTGLSPLAGAGAPAVAATGMTMMFAPATWVYAGEAYGNMKGGMDQKNASLALGAGFAMALFDMWGLKGLIGINAALKKDGMEQIAKIYAKKNDMTLEAARKKITNDAGNLQAATLKDIAAMSDLQMNKAVLAKSVGTRIVKGMGIEGGTEFMQESTGYFAGHLGTDSSIRGDINWEEWQRIAINATAGGFVLGGGIAGTTTAYGEIAGFNRLKREVSPAEKNKNWIGGNSTERADRILTVDDTTPSVIIDPNTGQPYVDPDAPPVTTDPPYSFEGAGRDWNKESQDEYEKGGKEDLSKGRGGEKTLWQNLKEFPERFTRKVGEFWEKRTLKAIEKYAKNPERAKEILGIIQTIAGMSNTSWMQDLNISDRKRLLQQKLLYEVSEFKARLDTLLGVGLRGKTSEEATAIFLEYLEAKANDKPTNPAYRNIEDGLEALRIEIGGQIEGRTDGITEMLRTEINNLVGETEGEVNKKPFWFQKSARLKMAEVLANKDEFIKTLVEADWTQEEAQEFFEFLESGPIGYDKSQLRELGFKNFPSRSLKQSKDQLYKIFGEDSKFLENDPFQRLRENIQEQVNYAVDRRVLGKDGERLKKLMLLLKDELGEGWDSRFFTHYIDSVAASRGDYRRMNSKRAERMIGHITFFNTFAHLDLAMLASLPEAAIVLLGATRDKQIMELFQTGVNDFARKYVTEGKHGYSYINPQVGMTRAQYTRNLADFYRYGFGTSTHGAIGQVGIDEAVYKASKIKEFAMRTFFRANLLKIYTDTTRVARLAIANDGIFGDLEIIAMFPPGHEARNTGLFHDAFERLRELNIDPDLVAARFDKVVHLARATLNDGKDTQALYDRILMMDPGFIDDMDIARMTWVDNAIAHPDAMNRPLWYSNPYYRLFTQYNGFMSVFTATLLPKMWKMMKGKDPTIKYSAFAIAATMVMLGFLSQAMKDEWRYGGRPGWLNDKGFIQRGVTSSGLVGTPEKILSAISPIYDSSKKPWESKVDFGLRRAGHTLSDLAGPTYAHGEQIAKMFLSWLDNDLDKRNIYLSREMPFLGKSKIWKDYNLGRGNINIDEAIKRSIPFYK